MANKGIENAEQIIEAFGGIRPMAKKIDVAVTTVQGWKKRNVIPGTRRELIAQAATEYNVDLDGLIADGVANENVSTSENVPPGTSAPSPKADIKRDRLEQNTDYHDSVIEDVNNGATDPDSFNEDAQEDTPINKSEKKVLKKQAEDSFDQPPVSSGLMFALIVALMIALGFGAVAAYFWQKSNTERAAESARVEAQRLAEVEAKLAEVEADVEENSGFLGSVIPKDLSAQIETLKEKTESLTQDVGTAIDNAQEAASVVSQDVLAKDAGNLEQRLTKLEGHLQDMTGKPVLAGMLARVNSMQADPGTEEVLANTVRELDALFLTLQQDAAGATNVATGAADQAINSTLDSARDQSAAIGQTFEAVPQEDLKAAAMLLGMAQLRSALNRDEAAFENDLSLLRKLVGEENPELNAALDRLAPHAEEGVLTPSGLSTELRTFAGDAVAASLSGEDVTVKERAKARMNELFAVQKDGELVTGTETQAALVDAEQLLQNGDIEAAISAVEGLDGPAADAMLPWLNKARASLSAQDAKGLVDNVMNSVSGAGGTLIRNEETGINIYVPKKNNITY